MANHSCCIRSFIWHLKGTKLLDTRVYSQIIEEESIAYYSRISGTSAADSLISARLNLVNDIPNFLEINIFQILNMILGIIISLVFLYSESKTCVFWLATSTVIFIPWSTHKFQSQITDNYKKYKTLDEKRVDVISSRNIKEYSNFIHGILAIVVQNSDLDARVFILTHLLQTALLIAAIWSIFSADTFTAGLLFSTITYAGYRKVMEEAMNQKKNREDEGEEWEDGTVDLDTVTFEYPVNISLVPVKESKSRRLTLAEQMTFENLTSFLYMDLYKGMAAGNLPRRCAHCRRWFLAVGGYDTRYCDRVVPGTGGKTCRKVGAHEREKEKQKTETAVREYSRIYNRLKARKRRGRITTDEWNRQVVQAQELKDAFLAKQITQQEYVRKLDEL